MYSSIINVIQYLNSPELVVKFQKVCGIYSIYKNDNSDKPSNGFNKDYNTPKSSNITNGIVKKDTLTSNGDYKDEQLSDTQTTEHCVKRSKFTAVSSDSDDDPTLREEFVATSFVLDWLFHFGASLGNEVFYITFFPYWFWNIDGYVGRRVCVFWCMFMYLGQASKDIVKWPRPSAPPVIRIEKKYALEYGMPSTHAMVGAGIPFTILLLTKDRYIYTFWYGLTIAVLWCTVVCLSRLYLGMHSVLDVLAGLLYIGVLMPLCMPWLDDIDYFLLHSYYAPFVAICLPLAMALMYPTLEKWSPARGDTTLILGVGCGISLGHWMCFQYGYMQKSLVSGPYDILWPDRSWFGLMFLRLVIGVTILVATRAVVKTVVKRLLVAVFPRHPDTSVHRELPLKFITYAVIAFNTVWLAPQVFSYMGIERKTYFTEI